jgi:hypothetical protein
MRSLSLSVLSLALALSVACGKSSNSTDPSLDDENLAANGTLHWFYSGPLPPLDQPAVTVSLIGHSARVTGFLPAGTTLPNLPHVRSEEQSDGRLKLDIVYPIATAAPGHRNSRPGVYDFESAKPYRPNGTAFTAEEGEHFVTWGGFPFLEYNEGIAFHGPITSEDADGQSDLQVWFLRRGDVSHGCNRMMGEHVVELAHILGISMHKVYKPNQAITPTTTAQVTVIDDYDTFNGKLIDVDYPTDTGAVRPKGNVEMFGSWVASDTDGHDLPADKMWEGGVRGKFYVFKEHMQTTWVCSVQPADLPALRAFAGGAELAPSFCEKRDCVLSALRAKQDAHAACGI